MTEAINLFAEKANQLKRALTEHQRQFRELFGEQIKTLFEEAPTVKSIIWAQYTPYFNDGDTCTFGVHDPQVTLLSESEEDEGNGYYERGYSFWNIQDYQGNARKIDGVTEAEEKDLRHVLTSIRPLFQLDNNAFLYAFGDHTIVTVTRDGIFTEEYDHD